jgi:alkylation response protein AidB-like acyl-CoA dehydrogenase
MFSVSSSLRRCAARAGARRLSSCAVQAADAVEDLDEEHRAIYETAYDFGAKELLPHAPAWDRDEHFPVEQLRAAAALGFGAIGVDPAHGGSGIDRLGSSLIYEALSNACASTAAYLSIHNMVGNAIEAHGSDAQRAEYLPRMATMETLASYCLTEPNSGSDAASLVTKAVEQGGDYVINGSKAFIRCVVVDACGWFLEKKKEKKKKKKKKSVCQQRKHPSCLSGLFTFSAHPRGNPPQVCPNTHTRP